MTMVAAPDAFKNQPLQLLFAGFQFHEVLFNFEFYFSFKHASNQDQMVSFEFFYCLINLFKPYPLSSFIFLFFPCRIPLCNPCQRDNNLGFNVWDCAAAVYLVYHCFPVMYTVLCQHGCGFTDGRFPDAPATHGE